MKTFLDFFSDRKTSASGLPPLGFSISCRRSSSSSSSSSGGMNSSNSAFVPCTVAMTLSSVRLATSLLRIATSLFLLISFHIVLSGWGADGVTLRVVNRCDFPIWPAVAPNGGYPVLADGGFFLPPGESTRVNTPVPWSGRLWARTGCEFDSPRPGLTCRTGDCQGRFACNGTTGAPPATLIEMNLQRHGRSFYDVSLVDGYNLAVSVSAAPPGDGGCFIGGCAGDPNAACPPELQVMDGGGEVVACKSACMAFDLDDYCCRNAFGNEETCRPSSYSMLFKEICPSYRTYAFDTETPTVGCSAHAFVVTFCPPAWGGAAAV